MASKSPPIEPFEQASADLVLENLARLKELFPEIVVDGKVDFDALRQLLGGEVDDSDEKFGLNWHGKRRARQLALTPSTGTLRPAPEDSVDWDTTQHLMIEGDNLEVLKLLQKSYAGRVKLIYIDPPYNTGGDFVYKDDFKDNIANYLELTGQSEEGRKASTNTESSGRFHTDWLNMMYPRLKLARNLLSHDGVIFASIDDHEYDNLKKSLDEIFGEENHLNTFVWVSNLKGRQISGIGAAGTKEYLLCYAKRSEDVGTFRASASDLKALMPSIYKGFNYEVEKDEHGEYVIKNELHNTNSAFNEATRPNLVFDIYYSPESGDVLTEPVSDDHIHRNFVKIPPKSNNNGANRYHAFRWSREKIKAESYNLHFAESSSGWKVYTKVRDVDSTAVKDLILDINTTHGSRDIEALGLDKEWFDYPKPIELIRLLCEVASDETSLVLDFFAGSGTTGHAVMAQNAEDGGNRRYVLVQLPEPLDPDNSDQRVAAEFCDKIGRPRNIGELTKERLRRAAAKIQEEHPDYDGDLGFRVFKLDSSNIRAWDPQPEDLEETLLGHVSHLKEHRSEQDVLYELLLKLGLDLCVPIETKSIAKKTVHSIGAGTLFACLDETLEADTAEDLTLGIVGWRDQLDPAGDTTVVFRDSAFPDDVTKSNVDAILKQYNITTVRSI